MAGLHLCQTDECSAANRQLDRALLSILRQLSADAPLDTAPSASTVSAADSVCSAAVSSEWSDWLDMLLHCNQLHRSQLLSTTDWLLARSLLQTRDGRAMALWQRWKRRLAQCDQQAMRDESEQYWLEGEKDGVGGLRQGTADKDEEGYVVELQAVLAEVAEEKRSASEHGASDDEQ